MTEDEKKTITREKHQGHKLVALNKKRKEKILRSKEQPTVQSTVQPTVQPTVKPTVQPTVQSTEQSTVQPTKQSTVQSSDTYIYSVGMLAVLTIGVCVFFT